MPNARLYIYIYNHNNNESNVDVTNLLLVFI